MRTDERLAPPTRPAIFFVTAERALSDGHFHLQPGSFGHGRTLTESTTLVGDSSKREFSAPGLDTTTGCFAPPEADGSIDRAGNASKSRARKIEIPKHFNVVPTDSTARKNFASVFQKIMYSPRHPASMERGASRSSRHVRRDCDGRFGDAREFFVRTNDAEADGKIVWS
ncbi:hypothetical protein [Bradyrhizobium sp.]|uniref:hypothetical protein n=1 Tax=Bradyrhizobium sp. TaxID=376 RepID=UPI0025B93845|nr:hypothetical protein [Bradyrhizobium sp.]MBV8917400.1 hypothetical protein [Bradyrhizobium sp.]